MLAARKAATCSAEGQRSHTCSVCTTTESEPIAINPDAHKYDAGVVNPVPNCINHGVRTYTCQYNSEHTYTEDVPLDPDNHVGGTYLLNDKEPTCEEDGYTGDTYCSSCDTKLTEGTKIDAIGHDWGEWETVTPAGCETTGLQRRICANDASHVEEKVLEATGHTEETVPGYAATCTATGLTDGIICAVCDKVLAEQEEIPMLPHTEVTIPGKAATCTETGLTEGKKCSVCDTVLVEQEEIPAKGHTEKVVPGKAATCTETGLTEGKVCKVCGKILAEQETIPAAGHSFGSWFTSVAPTCTKAGEQKRICSVCGVAETKALAALGHAFADAWTVDKAPTCIWDGQKSRHCTRCDAVTDVTVIPATGHVDADGDGKCDHDGMPVIPEGGYDFDTFRCKMCDKYEANKDIPFVGFIYTIVHFFVHLAHYIGYLT